MTTTNPTLLTMPIAKNGNKNAIPATTSTTGAMSQSLGFPPETSLPLGAGGVAPSREDFNGAFNFLSNIAFYAQKGWTFEYDENQDYYKGCVIIDPFDGNRYECVADMTAGTVAPHSDTANTYWKEFHLGGGLPIGTIFAYGGSTNPEGALLCNGAAVSRTMYADLFDVIGTTWGAGDGSTTFNLPRSEDLVLQGASALNPVGTYLQAGLPNITGKVGRSNSGTGYNSSFFGVDTAEGALDYTTASYYNINGTSSVNTAQYITIDASKSNPIYGASDTVQPPAACVNFYIQAFNASTDPALVDLTQILQDLANRLTREQTPAFNHRDVVTTSGTYTAPVTGWYRIEVKGGGGGGGGGKYQSNRASSGGGGGEGGTTYAWEHLEAGDTVSVVVGAGGTGGTSGSTATNGADGGNSTATANSNTYTGGGGKGGTNGQNFGGEGGPGGVGTVYGHPGEIGTCVYTSSASSDGGSGGGAGGGSFYYQPDGIQGGGGAGGSGISYNNTQLNGGNGGDGYVAFEYFAAIA